MLHHQHLRQARVPKQLQRFQRVRQQIHAVSSTTKKPTKKPVKKKKKVKKTATPIPSPLPVWPPIKFTSNKGIYAKIPTSKELLGLISAKAGFAELVKKCESNACGAVIVAADYRCEWWEIKSTVYGVDPSDVSKKIALGKLRTLYGPLSAKTYANIILVSDEPLYGPSVLDPELWPNSCRPSYEMAYQLVESLRSVINLELMKSFQQISTHQLDKF